MGIFEWKGVFQFQFLHNSIVGYVYIVIIYTPN
jgi:hypothetical protein